MIVACIPFYNDFVTIEEVLEKTIKYADLILVIDDGSNPPLSSIFSNITSFKKKVVILRNEKRKGYGYALKLGLLLSRKYCATFAITLDADAQHNPDDIPKFINELLSLNTDIVIGNRFKGKSHVPTTDAMIIKLISYIFSSIINFKIEDTLCGFRALRLALLDDMAIEKISDDMGFPLELLAIAIRKGWRIKEVPVKVRYHNLSKRGLARKSIQLVQILRSLIRVFLEVSIR